MQRRDALIDTFIGHFRAQHKKIAEVHDPVFRQLLCAVALDPLARAAYGPAKRHRDNLQKLLEEQTVWPGRKKVSLEQLLLRLKRKSRGRHRLAVAARRVLAQLPPGRRYPSIDLSPDQAELIPLAAGDELKYIADSTYSALFCAYRNTLVHEFKPPARSHDWSERKDYPFYGISSYSDRELVFPVAFFQRVLGEAIDGVETHLRSNRIDPYKNFEFDAMWHYR
jgi:hypothetical protein